MISWRGHFDRRPSKRRAAHPAVPVTAALTCGASLRVVNLTAGGGHHRDDNATERVEESFALAASAAMLSQRPRRPRPANAFLSLSWDTAAAEAASSRSNIAARRAERTASRKPLEATMSTVAGHADSPNTGSLG